MLTSQLKSKWRQEKRNQDHTRNQDLCSIAEFQACEPPIPLMVLVICTELCWHGNSMNVQISIGLDQNPIQKLYFCDSRDIRPCSGTFLFHTVSRRGGFLLLQIGQCMASCCGNFCRHVQNTSKGYNEWSTS